MIHVFAKGLDQQLHNCTFDEMVGLWQWSDTPAPPNNIGILMVLGATTAVVGGVQFVFTFVHAVSANKIFVRISQEGGPSAWQSVKKAQPHLLVSQMSLITYDDGVPHSYGWCTTDTGELLRLQSHWFGGAVEFEEINAGKPGGNSVPLFGRPGAITYLTADKIPQHAIEVYAVGDVPFGGGSQLCCDFRAVSADDIDPSGSTWIWSIPPGNQGQSAIIHGVAADLTDSLLSPSKASVYVTGVGGNVWWFTKPSVWTSLKNPPNTQVTGIPSAVSYRSSVAGMPLNVEHVMVMGKDGSVHGISPGGPWINLGNPGTEIGDPNAIAIPPASPGHLGPIVSPVHVYCVGHDGRLYASTKQPNGQFVWSTPLGA